MKNIKKIFAVISMFALAFFGLSFSAKVHATTTPVTTNHEGQSEFKHDVEQGVQEVKNDKDAQNNQQEIDNEDSEHAGDEHGDVKEIDGKNNQNEIDNEIELEVDGEDISAGHSSSDQEHDTTSTSTRNRSSEVNTGDNQ